MFFIGILGIDNKSKEIKELDNKLYKENEGVYKFYFEHIKNNEVIDKGRIDVGTRDIGSFEYLEEKLKELEKKEKIQEKKVEKVKENKWSKKLEKSKDNELEL